MFSFKYYNETEVIISVKELSDLEKELETTKKQLEEAIKEITYLKKELKDWSKYED